MSEQGYNRATPADEAMVREWQNHRGRDLVGAVARVGKDGNRDLESELVALLDHDEWSVRSASIEALLKGLRRDEYFTRAVDMLMHDDQAAPEVAMTLSSWVRAEAPERFSAVMELLLRRMLEADDDVISGYAYTAAELLVQLAQPNRPVASPSPFDLRRDVDWGTFAKWVPPELEVPEGVLSTREVSTPEDLDTIRSADASTDDKIEAMERLLLDRRQEARGAIEQLYRSDDPRLAAAALRAYPATWGTVTHPIAGWLLNNSPHEDVRLAAVEALATLDQTLAMGFSAATSWLLGAVRSDESPTVRRAAYVAVLRAVAPDEASSVPDDDFDPDRDIDWDLLHGVLPEGA